MLREILSLCQEYRALLNGKTIVVSLRHMKWLGAFMCITPHIVGATTSESAGYAYVEKYSPDFLIASDSLEEGSGLSLVRRAEKFNPSIRSILVIPDDSTGVIQEALDAGCDGICFESEPFTPAFRVVARGGIYYPREVERILRSKLAPTDNGPPVQMLTDRERAVLSQVMLGFSNKQIGQRLNLSPETVKTHVAHIFTKLGARDRAHASVLGIAHGFISLEEVADGFPLL